MKALLHYRASDGFRAALAAIAGATGVAAMVVDEDDEAAFAREIVDTDVLSAGNLGRHWLTAQHIGASKAKACAKELKAQFIGVSVHALVD
ncbi:MAG: hypothetical protein ACK53I_12455, partial [Phenylobacterium sp.]